MQGRGPKLGEHRLWLYPIPRQPQQGQRLVAKETQRQIFVHQFVVKAVQGRGPKLGEHRLWLYPILLVEFERLRKAGVKMSTRLLLDIAISDSAAHSRFHRPLNIVYRRLKDKKQVRNETQRELHCSVATHLGELKRLFVDNLIDPSRLFNIDKSHFVIDLDDGERSIFVGSSTSNTAALFQVVKGLLCVSLLTQQKKGFLETAAERVRRVNSECDKIGVNWPHPAMHRFVNTLAILAREYVTRFKAAISRLAKPPERQQFQLPRAPKLPKENEVVEQLGKNLQEIVAEHPEAFRQGYEKAVQSISL
ncbi:Hypothetical protein PHPALM_1149 [Phytophthora palmivora]|uniref:Uncharacterized protein n=1 Tax=Phytophthora palmivora TaxID=4796 RepID=A0A2P4YT28_9STRA|nr:Hypothetical protein PHPALM_1149 [Phytophthora palmivora]